MTGWEDIPLIRLLLPCLRDGNTVQLRVVIRQIRKKFERLFRNYPGPTNTNQYFSLGNIYPMISGGCGKRVSVQFSQADPSGQAQRFAQNRTKREDKNLHGHPQCLKNTTTTGFSLGNCTVSPSVGAQSPTWGTGTTSSSFSCGFVAG